MKQGNDLNISLAAIDVKKNRFVWQQTMKLPVQRLDVDAEAVGDQTCGEGLVPVLVGRSSAIETATRPKNPEAYDLYLRSSAVPHDPVPNREAIKMLERSVGLDATYAPAWDALGFRYYYDAQYGNGGQEAYQRAGSAYERAVALDPNYLQGSAHLVRHHVERGELSLAYKQAKDLVKRRSDNAQAHFTMAYVLRYAGMLEQSVNGVRRGEQVGSGQLPVSILRVRVLRKRRDRQGDAVPAYGCRIGLFAEPDACDPAASRKTGRCAGSGARDEQ